MPGKLTQEDFVRKSNEVHNGKYDYSLSEYTSNHAKVRIICPIHGEFEQRASAHMAGQGCPKCRKNAPVTQEVCLARFQEVHGDRYDYSLVRYVNNTTKVRIICREHGEFEQTPAAHVNGQGCPRCVKNAPVDQAECLRRFHEVHGDEYDYSDVEYANKDKPVKIICRKHGVFLQSPANHWHGQGCPRCYGTGKLDTQEFIRRSREVHGDRYDYSQVEYVNNHTKVRIICPVHGVFEQVPMSHLKGINCPECANVGRKAPLSPEKMASKLEKAKATWQAKYGVDNVMLVSEKVAKMEVTCLDRHGVRNYRQSPKCIEQSRATNVVRYGAPSYAQSEEYKRRYPEFLKKTIATKNKNHSHNSSSQEERAYTVLCEKFGVDDVFRQYMSDVYPFPCDFYIKSIDTYIEMNLTWYHCGRFYNPDSRDDQEWLEELQRRRERSDCYETAINTWTRKDVKKRDTALANELNYVVFWKLNMADFYEWLNQIA